MNPKVLYIGNFQLPDKNAAAHRVINIAKSLRDLKYDVVFFGVGESRTDAQPMQIEGFSYYNVFTTERGEHFREMFQIRHVTDYLRQNRDVRYVIAYNYPSFALARIARFCKKHGIRVLADCTEWYDGKGGGFVSGLLKKTDTLLRMRVVHKRLDGMIAISDYLYDYYSASVPSVKIPPTVDPESEKYSALSKRGKRQNEKITVVYSGSPSASKELLGSVVACMNQLAHLPILLRVVGISRENFIRMYHVEPESENVVFHGRVPHGQALELVADSDYALIFRPDSRLTRAGFPTKFVEAISCGTPVIANDTSDLANYFADGKNGYMVPPEELDKLLSAVCDGRKAPTVCRETFDYRNYTQDILSFLEKLGG